MSLDTLLARLAPGGRDFERLCKWLLENVPEYRTKLTQVWFWDDWPGRSSRDIGIDLVAEDREGGLWAIQAKHYNPDYSIKKADLDSFLSASSRAEFSYRLLIATTDHLGANARSTLAIQEKPVGMLLRSQLEALGVAWPASTTRLRPAKPARKRPRPHQRRAIRDCVCGLAQADRGQLVMACGTGKTLVGPFLAEKLGAKRVLVLVPSLSLLGQTLREWATATDFDYLAVCSDVTVTKDEQDAVVASTSELGIPVTTDAERIARFLRRRSAGTKVIFSTYQSSPQIAVAQAGRVPAFDLVIADEAHRCAGPQAGVYATVLDSAKIKARKRLFMTATPRYFTGRVKKEAKEADWEVASMDEEAKFGGVLHRLTFAQAIDQDLLSDYQVVVVGVSDGEAHDLALRGAFVTRDGKTVTDARTLARQIGLLRSMAKYNLRRVVTFHSRIDSASRFASSLLDTKEWLPARRRPKGTLWTDHVSGKMTAGERDARLRRLKAVDGDERGVLTNARCLNEGVDVPTLDGVAFIDPRRSQVDVVQAVGRAIRKAPDKTVGTIVIPVLVDQVTDPGEALAASEFDRVWEVVRALRDHDDDLADELDALRREHGQRGSVSERPRKIVLDLPVRISRDFASAFDSKLVETTTAPWEFWFGLLERFAARQGHARTTAFYVEDGYQLGQWVRDQRTAHKRSKLTADRVARLEAVPGWVWDELAANWESKFATLQLFVEREGSARVPIRHVENGFALGAWVQVQRSRHKCATLNPQRAAALEALPGWAWDANDATWEQGFSYLERFVRREGHARMTRAHVEEGYRLGGWVKTQRSNRSRLSSDRITRLETQPGWTWDTDQRAFEDGLYYLALFVAREGHANVSARHIEDCYRLGSWVMNQRQFRKQNRLSEEKVARLKTVPSWMWDTYDDRWESNYAALRRFAAREGHSRVPTEYVEDSVRLGRWVAKRRQDYRSGRLTPERVARLEALPGWVWHSKKAQWERGYAALWRFIAREGNNRVPRSHVEDGFALGNWIVRQRQLLRLGELNPSHRERLESLPGWTWAPHSAAFWEDGFSQLVRYVEREGHARVPGTHVVGGFPLGQWLGRNRQAQKRGTLSPDRRARLEALPGWIWVPRASLWEDGFSHLEHFVRSEGHARVAKNHLEDGFRLGEWVSTQRAALKRGTLSTEQIARLDALPRWVWNTLDAEWNEGFSRLERFVEREGHARVTTGASGHIEEGFRLGQWVTTQRHAYRRRKLSAARSGRLEALPGWTWEVRQPAQALGKR